MSIPVRYRALAVAILALAYVALCRPLLPGVFEQWDEGNLLYPSVAWNAGLIPNLDFVNGYPGLFHFLLAQVIKWTGGGTWASNVFQLAAVLVSAGAGALFLAELGGLLLAALGFVTLISVSYLMWPPGGPGHFMAACTMLGALGVWSALRRWEQGPAPVSVPVRFVAGAFFLGLSLSFKQSGIFSVVGFSLVWMALVLRRLEVPPRRALAVAIPFAALPLAIFLALRFHTGISSASRNALTLVPWPVVLCLFAEWIRRGGLSRAPSLPRATLVAAALACLAGSFAWIALYPSPSSVPFLLHELFVRVPRLIDRDAVTVAFDKREVIPLVFLGYVLLASRAGGMSRRLAAAYSLLAALALAWVFRASPGERLRLGAPPYWDTYLLPPIVFSFAMILLIARGAERLSFDSVALFAIGAVVMAANFPHFGNERFTPLAFVAVVAAWRLVLVGVGGRLPAAPAFAVLFLALAGLESRRMARESWASRLSVRDFPALGRRLAGNESSNVFLDVAEWLARHSAAEDSVAGYPNFAMVLAQLGRVRSDRFPNFIGDAADFRGIVEQIEKGDGPRFFLVSPTIFPFEAGNPYFPDPAPLLAALRKGYRISARFECGKGKDEILVWEKERGS